CSETGASVQFARRVYRMLTVSSMQTLDDQDFAPSIRGWRPDGHFATAPSEIASLGALQLQAGVEVVLQPASRVVSPWPTAREKTAVSPVAGSTAPVGVSL
ncbi:MAG: hypothetical protein K2W96_02775, partial [Gemmataceae bacterium]|nr:hypothetical protein [Gemmataceae bacterium]